MEFKPVFRLLSTFSSCFPLGILLRGLRRQMLNIKRFETWAGMFSYIATKKKMRTVRFAVLM